MKVENKRRLLLLLLAAAAAGTFAGIAAATQRFVRPADCIPSALTSAAVNSSISTRTRLECAMHCVGLAWCAAVLMGRSGCFDCGLIDWELYYSSWVGQGADCPDGLYEREAAVEWLRFSSCQQIDESSWNFPCSRATDGNTNQNFFDGSCTHTNVNSINWWRASLPQRAYIDRVGLYNREGGDSFRLNNFTISLDGAVFASYFEASAFSVRNFSCGRVGQTVQVDHRFSHTLTLCEVIVYGKRFY